MQYLLFIIAILTGFLSGGLMFSYYIPKLVKNINIVELSPDNNPGVANAVTYAGWSTGMICLVLDLLKGFLPIAIALRFIETDNLLFSVVLFAPVLGHAVAPFNLFKGGKSIAVSFGVLIALMPLNYSVIILAFFYIIFSTLFKINPIRKRSILTYAIFAVLAFTYSLWNGNIYIGIGCVLISLIVIYKHIISE